MDYYILVKIFNRRDILLILRFWDRNILISILSSTQVKTIFFLGEHTAMMAHLDICLRQELSVFMGLWNLLAVLFIRTWFRTIGRSVRVVIRDRYLARKVAVSVAHIPFSIILIDNLAIDEDLVIRLSVFTLCSGEVICKINV